MATFDYVWRSVVQSQFCNQLLELADTLLQRWERRCHTGLEEFPVRHDKAVRAQSIRARMELRGGLYVPAKASWLSDLKAELLAFPTGRHDDIVDALGLVGQLVDKWCAGPQPIDNVVRFRRPEDFKDYCIESELERDSGWTWKMI